MSEGRLALTISTTASSTTVAGNNATKVFSFSFVADAVSDIEVIFTNSSGQQTTLLPSQYLVAINPTPTTGLWGVGGTVTYPLSGSAIAANTKLTIQRILPLTQETSISNQGDFSPEVIEQALDTATMQLQQVSARTGQIRGTWISGVLYNYGDFVVDGTNGSNTGNIYMCAIPNTSAVWTTDLAAGDWVLALNVSGIVNALPTIPNNTLFANISGSTAAPTGVTLSALLDAIFGTTQGALIYRSGSVWTVLSPGTNGQVLQTQGAGANPQWSNTAGSGSVTNVATGTGLTGGPITTTGTVSLATISTNALLANISGSTAAPTATTLSALLDTVIGNTQGSIMYRAGTLWSILTPGTSGQFLQTQGAGANPQWAGGVPISWTPVLNINGSTTGITYTTQTGSYIRFGRFIVAELTIILSSKGSGTGNVTITGLPASASNTFGMANMDYYAVIAGNTAAVTGYVQGNTITPVLQSSSSQPVPFTDANIGNTTQFIMTCMYITT